MHTRDMNTTETQSHTHRAWSDDVTGEFFCIDCGERKAPIFGEVRVWHTWDADEDDE